MKFLFVSKPLKYAVLGPMYLSRILKDNGVDVRFHVIGQDIKEIIDWKPDFIGCSVMTGSQKEYLAYIRELKKKMDFTSIFGGPHPTYFPKFIEEDGVDYICRGEGEMAILKIIKKPEEKIIFEPLVKDLDKIPFPDRDLLYQDKFHYNYPIKHFIATRGCPYNCPYCYNSANFKMYQGQKWCRIRSVENVIAEIKEVINKYPTELVYFQDDTFIIDKNWILKFCEMYQKEIKLPFHCIVRLNLLDEEIAFNLSRAGCICVRCAAESGNDYVREKILKRKMTKEDIIEGTGFLHKYNITFILQNILGLPQVGLKEDLETLDLNIKCRPTLAWSSIFQPYPGTELGDMFPEVSVDDIGNNFYDDSVLDILEKKQRLRLQKLFGIVSRFSWLRPILPILLNLKLDWLYRKIWQREIKRADKILYRGILK